MTAVPALPAFAGLRKREILGLQRRYVGLRAGMVRVEQALPDMTGGGAVLVEPKTVGSRRTVAIPSYLVEKLAEHLDRHVDGDPHALLFTNGRCDPVRRSLWHPAWDDARKAAGLDDLRLYDLHHLAGTLTAYAGATLKETMDWLGHSSAAARPAVPARRRPPKCRDCRQDGRSHLAVGTQRTGELRRGCLSQRPVADGRLPPASDTC